jgi:hypothetical protein
VNDLTARPAASPIQARPPLVLSERERELIEYLRQLDFMRYNKQRTAVVMWNGARLIIMECLQVR